MLIISCTVNHTNQIDLRRLKNGKSRMGLLIHRNENPSHYEKNLINWDFMFVVIVQKVLVWPFNYQLLILKYKLPNNTCQGKPFQIHVLWKHDGTNWPNTAYFQSFMPSGQQLFRRFPCKFMHPLPSTWADQ